MPTVELSMIVKNGGEDFARCLKSAAPFVDRIVVGDTGSSDDSKNVAREAGAEIIDVCWENDFAKARNKVLDHRKCDWVLVLDADQMLDPLSGENIRDFICEQSGSDQSAVACHHVVWDYVTESISRIGYQSARRNPFRLEESRPYPAYVPHHSLSLFRNHPEIYFEGSVHETVLNRIQTLGLPAKVRADIVVHHFGFVRDSEEKRRAKNELYHAIGEAKLQENPSDVKALVELGVSYLEHRKNAESAFVNFARAREIDPACAAAWLYAGVCLSRLNRADEALVHLQHAKELGLVSGVLYQAEGDAYFHRGSFAEASEAYATIEKRGEASPLSEAKRGASEIYLGQIDAGLNRIQEAVKQAPSSGELYDILASAALLAGRLPVAVQAMQARIAMGNVTDFHHQLVAMIQARITAQKVS